MPVYKELSLHKMMYTIQAVEAGCGNDSKRLPITFSGNNYNTTSVLSPFPKKAIKPKSA
jgi:hypothetical protein